MIKVLCCSIKAKNYREKLVVYMFYRGDIFGKEGILT